jgi:pyrimidine operon attenuation protein/uracil phosphoribosyltransferase
MRSKEMIKRTIKKVNNSLIDKNKPARRSVMTNAIDTTEERIATVAQENVQTQKQEMSKAEICFGAIMAIAAIA